MGIFDSSFSNELVDNLDACEVQSLVTGSNLLSKVPLSTTALTAPLSISLSRCNGVEDMNYAIFDFLAKINKREKKKKEISGLLATVLV